HFVSACNRTLHGEAGRTYELQIQNPHGVYPFVCHLNFTATGGYGDIVQLNLAKFSIGKFVENYHDVKQHGKCTEGFMTISEQGLPNLDGRWCGTASGYTIYYSETKSVNVTLRLDKQPPASGSVSNGFEFRLIYKFLRHSDAKLRAGVIEKIKTNDVNALTATMKWEGKVRAHQVASLMMVALNLGYCILHIFLTAERCAAERIGKSRNTQYEWARIHYNRWAPTHTHTHRSSCAEGNGENDNRIWNGDLVPGSYCNRNFYDCDKRTCRIRSPNYPGIYPRNLTCKYYINHRAPPSGLHAMIVLRQPDGHKLNMKEQATHHEANNRILRGSPAHRLIRLPPLYAGGKVCVYICIYWEQCDEAQDYLSIYDGAAPEAPTIGRICGGDVLPDIVSSGPEMRVEFHTSPYDVPFHPNPVTFLPGFELEVHVLYVNSNSQSYIRQPGRCEFIVSAFESQTGELESPQHTLPPESSCLYHFQGRRHETVWVSFIKYHSAIDPTGFESPAECVTQLRIWDGRWSVTSRPYGKFEFVEGSPLRGGKLKCGIVVFLGAPPEYQRNASLIEQICREEVPRLCSRSLVAKGSRPCSTQESYLSTGSDLTIEYRPSPIGTARLYGPASAFKLRYEFVDNSLGGAPLEPLFHPKSCDRVFRSSSASRGIFRSPSNVFMYGRGGSPNISCIIRFEASGGESVRLTITRARFGGRSCQNLQNRSGRWHCNHHGGPVSDLRISEVPWTDVSPLPRDCLCSDVSGSITLAPLAASIVEVKFTTLQMEVDQDFRDFYFEGRYEFARDGCETDWSERRLRGRSGDAYLKPTPCPALIQPWLLEPETDSSYLVLKLKGFWMPPLLQSAPPCPTDARITVYSTNNPKNSRDLCPSGPDVVAFSDGWDRAYEFSAMEISKSLIIEFKSPRRPPLELIEYKFSWMEIFPAHDCPHRCQELQACIPAELWCDGKVHCPSGQDESPTECDLRLPLSPLHVGLAAATLTLVLSLAAGLTACARRK
ncbi:AGAP010817-PA, partial [Anopheles gambiae str. PEST]